MDAKTTSAAFELIAGKVDLSLSEITLEETLEEIGLDSLHLMEMAMSVQRDYGNPVPEGDLRLDQTVAEAIAYLDGRMR
ncbi:MAG TPA: phosphopantetheine-binding protein [Amycolatopsis sp.]|uniref:phosphopantetheine-binding protein n=1 Tax=Amycolatopsis sp. TaxID=37632 RepID=UPI002B473153|nr:phosphopantetheine-binding protein [Amycolatopsis sp.]HKS50147.1 phosphopantetheine-binding protein [Amycolatopsis sp.]